SPLNISFYGLGNLSAYGTIQTSGHFSLTGSVGFDESQSGGELWGSIGVTISDQGLSGSFSGGASALGVTLASVSGSLD
ncbi:hypothetical protein NL529_33990, partial [Klebsiella pneumoniae]|nr:hypothetical protein [Klebsiella pneumoniae]